MVVAAFVLSAGGLGQALQNEKNDRTWLNSTHSRDELLAPIPRNSDHDYVLGTVHPVEASASDGTTALAVIHASSEEGNQYRVLRVWTRRGGRYSFRQELIATEDDVSFLSAEFFRFRGQL